jgi:hypothetical protein
MPSKTFASFTQIATESTEAENTDFLVGYKPGATPYEIRLTLKDLSNSLDLFLDPNSLNGSKVQFVPEGANVQSSTVISKLNQLRTTNDYLSPAAAANECKNQRLFIPNGVTIELDVPNDFTTLAEALEAITNWYIENGALVKIKITADVDVDGSLDLNHPCGQNIQIVGNGIGGSAVRIIIQQQNLSEVNFNLFECTDGHKFGLIDNVNIEGRAVTGYNWGINNYAAVKASYGSHINLGPDVTIKNWYIGVHASYGSTIFAESIDVTLAGEAAFLATEGSSIKASSSTATTSRTAGVDLVGTGYKASGGSFIDATRSVSREHKAAGYMSLSNSTIDARGSLAENNGYDSFKAAGYLAKEAGSIECTAIIISGQTLNTSSRSNTGFGYEIRSNGIITGDFNGQDNSRGIINIYSSVTTTGSYPNELASLVSNSGNLNVYTSGTNRQVIFNDLSEVVAPLTFQAGTELQAPLISVTGSSATINLNLQPKGNSGRVIVGTETSSNLQFGQYVALSTGVSLSATGYVQFYDRTGTLRKLLVAAN